MAWRPGKYAYSEAFRKFDEWLTEKAISVWNQAPGRLAEWKEAWLHR